MPPSEFRYGAFISYRHVEPDRSWAKWLHRELETYRVPKSLQSRGIAPRVARVFRDEEELAASPTLSAAIEEALVQSAFLIVVCSPRTPESRWVNQEVLRFRELGRGDQILALLIEGDPEASFPRALCEVRPAAPAAAEARVDEIEPLAADVRPLTGDSPRRLKRMAKLKLIATVLGCRFDDLRQRDQERRTRRLAALSLVLGLLVIGVTALALFARAQQLRADREATVATAQRLAAQARVHFADRPDLAALLAAEATLLDDSTAVTASLLDSLENDARLQTFLRGHTAPIHTVAFSRDGQWMASGGEDRTIRLWNARTWAPVGVLENAHPQSVSTLAFSPDGSTLASGGGETVRLWKVASRAAIGAPLQGHTQPVRSVVFDRTGTVLLSSSSGETIRWDLRTAPPSAAPFGDEGTTGNLALSPDGRLLAVGSGQSVVALWDRETGRLLHQQLESDGLGVFVQSLAFGPDGRLLAATDDFGLTLWDLSGPAPERKELADDVDFLLAVAISPDGKWLAAGGNDARVRLWDLETGRQNPRPMIGHAGFVTALAFHPDGATLVSGSEDGTMIVWTPAPRSRVRQSVEHPGRIVSAAFSPDDRLLATGTDGGDVVVWDVASGRPVKRHTLDAGGLVGSLVFAGDSLLACANDELRRWNVGAARPGNAVVPGGCADAVFTDGGTFQAQLRPSSESSADGEPEYTVTIAPLENGSSRPRTAAVRFKGSPSGRALSDDGRYVAVGTHEGEAWLWDLQANPPARRELRGHAGRIGSLAFSPGGATLATGGHDTTIRLWDVSSGSLRQPPREAPRLVHLVRFDRTGTRLAAVYGQRLGEPPALQLWNVAAGIPIGAPLRSTGPEAIGNVVTFSPNGRWVAAGGDDGQLLLLDTAMETWRAEACRFANRNLSPTEEWPVYFPGQPYRKTCADLPLPISIPRRRHDQEEELF